MEKSHNLNFGGCGIAVFMYRYFRHLWSLAGAPFLAKLNEQKRDSLSTVSLVGEAGLDLRFRRERKLMCCRRPAAGRVHLIGSSPST